MRQLITTSDGSHSVFDAELNVTFHSRHGAIQESQHIFVDAGLRPLLGSRDIIRILEIGFGTGLNALLTYIAAAGKAQVFYYTVENNPLTYDEFSHLNYVQQLGRSGLQHTFQHMHSCAWNTPVEIEPWFTLFKSASDATAITTEYRFDLVYFDAFDPVAQPELWTQEVFEMLHSLLENGGSLVTYSSKSSVQKNLRAAGFDVVKLKGPPGKREFVLATAR